MDERVVSRDEFIRTIAPLMPGSKVLQPGAQSCFGAQSTAGSFVDVRCFQTSPTCSMRSASPMGPASPVRTPNSQPPEALSQCSANAFRLMQDLGSEPDFYHSNSCATLASWPSLLLSRPRIRKPQISRAPVYLNVYHLDDGWQRTNRNLFGIGGAFHAGVEVFGVEWTFGCEGVCSGTPRCHRVHVFQESVLMGETECSREVVADIIRQLTCHWRGEDYDMLSRNCCSFSSTLCEQLVGRPIPAWVNRFAKIVSAVKVGAQVCGAVDIDRVAVDLQLIDDRTPSKTSTAWSEISC